ncbi:dystroglycan-like [Dorcoceras hygrometricum]|uniref:Dystroglycan-like n=1 Tax=Dorcoceras hygrometricum TaxID=472368 RepID=A0A2Z7ASV2_9LAMI|nr:dystroglycan-like [Dorcoceras hygrometricum]
MEIPGIVLVLHALTASGLEGFLGCPAVIYESELVEFFNNGSVKDGLVVSTVNGVPIEISEHLLAETFELPVDGLSELSEMPKDKIYDARSIVSLSGEPVNLSGRKGQMKIEYRLLCDIMEKSISVKAGSFNALTVEKFALLTAVVCGIKMNWASVLFNIFKKMVTPGAKQAKGYAVQISLLLENFTNLNLGESLEFPVSKILTVKTVHRYIFVTDKEITQEIADASPVKQAPTKPRASKKRPAAVPMEAPVVKKTRSLKKKSSSSQSALEMVVVAQEAIPIQIIPATPAVEPMVDDQQAKIVEEHPSDEVAATAGEQEPVGEQVEEQPAVESSLEKPVAEGAAEETADDISEKADEPVVEPVMANVVNNEVSNADDVDHIIQQVLSETAQSISTEEVPWFVLPFIRADRDTERVIETASDSANAMAVEVESQDLPAVRDSVVSTVGEQEILAFGEQLMGTNDESSADTEAETVEKSVDEFLDDDETSLKKLATINIEEMYKKEEQVLSWGETESPQLAIQRKLYILLKYREVLVRKFLESWKSNFVLGHGSSAVDLKVIELLSDLHQFILEELSKEARAHGLLWKKTCCSKIFEGSPADRGAVIARTNTNTRSSCWIRTMMRVDGAWLIEQCADRSADRGAVIARTNTNTRSSCWIRTMMRVDGAWLIEQCADRWVKIPQLVISCEVHRQHQYDDTLPPVNIFYKTLTKRWADICLEVVDFCASRRLLPVGSLQFCGSVSVIEPVYRVAPRQSSVFAFRFSQFCSVFVDFSLFSWLPPTDITDLLSSIALDRTAFRGVQIAQERTILRNIQSSVLVAPSVQLSLDQRQSSHISSSDGDPTINFTSDDVQLQDRPVDNRTSLPASSTDLSEAIDDLKTYLAQSIADSQNDILSKLNTVAGRLHEDLQHHENTVRAQVNNSCQETRLHINGLIVNMGEYRKGVQTFGASVKSNNLDTQRKIDAQQAKLDDLDTQIAAMRNDQLEFKAKIAADLLSLSTQIGDIVDYLRSGDAKKGEGSSRRPLPTPVHVERRPLPIPQPSPDVQGSGQFLSVEQAVELVCEADRRDSKPDNCLCSTVDYTEVKVADPPVVSTADPDFLLLQLTSHQTSSDFSVRDATNSKYSWTYTINTVNHKDITLLFVYGSSDINIVHLPFFRSGKDPLEDLIYTSCTDPIQQPAAARTPRLYTSPRLCQSLVLRLCEKV